MEVPELKLERICRLCLEEKCGQLINIFRDDSSLYENILRVTAIKIQEGDGLPPHVCQQCASLVNAFISFQRKCVVADVALHHYVRKCLCHKEHKECEAVKYCPRDPLQLTQIIKTESGPCQIKSETSVFQSQEELITGFIEENSVSQKVDIKTEEKEAAKNKQYKTVHRRRKRKGRWWKIKSNASNKKKETQSNTTFPIKRKNLETESTYIKKQKVQESDRLMKLVIPVEGNSLCCSQCDARFDDVEKLKSHLELEHKKRVIRWHTVSGTVPETETAPFLCTVCGRRFTSQRLFTKHHNQRTSLINKRKSSNPGLFL